MYRMSRVFALVVLLSESAAARAFAEAHPIVEPARNVSATIRIEQLVDARSYLHCHNLPRHIYCHKGEPLPRNWPPNSDTPATSSLREIAGGHHHVARRRPPLWRDGHAVQVW